MTGIRILGRKEKEECLEIPTLKIIEMKDNRITPIFKIEIFPHLILAYLKLEEELFRYKIMPKDD